MPIESTQSIKNDLTVFTVTGHSDPEELITVITAFHAAGPTRNALWDFTRAEVWDFSGEDVEKISDLSSRFDENRAGAKVALLASDEMTEALLKLFILFGDLKENRVRLQLFRTKAQALDWLLSPV